MALPKYRTVTRTQGNNRALKEGAVKPRAFEFDFVEVDPLIDAFRRMVRALEFDISELALTTYLAAREHGKRFTALPIFLVRAFHHGAIVVNTRSGIRSPKDLEGKRVGVARGYTVTTGVWARSVLQHEHGVDLSKVTWVLSGDEHVAEFQPPANVVPLEKGRRMADLVISGELPAAINVDIDHPDVKPLLANPKEAGLEALRKRGHYPINHTIVVKDELLAAHPELAADVFEAFAESKRRYVAKLQAGALDMPTAMDETLRRVMEITGKDPLPYGIEPNRGPLEELIASAKEQGIIRRAFAPGELFAPSTRGLVG
ncbi:MAG TPA: PhnD/SsuA/transferrin family substrate-binding protein [Usitatibacter sp.]|nr:PhnD/SsuA/transferrin family substrate-binding protein [Usitatibacter sp.]